MQGFCNGMLFSADVFQVDVRICVSIDYQVARGVIDQSVFFIAAFMNVLAGILIAPPLR